MRGLCRRRVGPSRARPPGRGLAPESGYRTLDGNSGTRAARLLRAAHEPTRFTADGLRVDTRTGLISGTPTQTGEFTVTTTAGNAAGDTSGTLTLTVNTPPPTPWTYGDLGDVILDDRAYGTLGVVAVQTPGNTAYEDGTFVVRGAGTDLSANNQDMTAQFVRQPVTGDCEITARLVSRSGASGDRVGLLMAKSPSPFDQAAGAIVTGGTGAQLMLRTTVAGKSAFTGNTTVGAPCLLRLKRTGTTFTACASTDDGATCALRRQVGGTEANAECAAKILNAWSSTLTTVTGNADRFLAAGIYGWEFANAAELMCGYDAFDLAAFQDMIVGVFYPLDNSFLTHHNDACITNYWANWDLCNMASVMAIGILTDDAATYDQAVTSFTSGAGNGSIEHAVPYLYTDADGYALGQWQESGRDQGHTIMGMGQMGALCEMAWNQGDDLYSYDNRKFFKAAQYVAKYNTGQDVPCTTYTWGSGQNCAQQSQTVIGSGSRGRVRPVWAMLHFHYNRRLYLDDTYISAMYDLVAPEGGGGDYGSPSGGYDQLGFGTLTYAK